MNKHLTRIIMGGAVFVAALLLRVDSQWLQPALFLVSYVVTGGDIVAKAVRQIAKGMVFDENFLMSIATLGAFAIGEYPEGVAVMLFYQIGEYFQNYAVNKSRKSIAALMDIRPDHANVQRGDEWVQVDPDEVQIGETILVKPGERVPLDGIVLEGFTTVDTSALTGESVPREVEPGHEILSGCINLSGVITVRVTKEYEESTVNKILDLVENASSKKAKSEQFITRFARVYTPVVVIMAVLLAVIPPLVVPGETFSDWLYRALTFLVVSCPCALVVSIPLSFFSGLGGASKRGILVKGSNYLEALARTEIVVFDKTGTLTKGVFKVRDVRPEGMSSEDLLEVAAHAESFSTHPIAASLREAYGQPIDRNRVSGVEEIAGRGVSAMMDGKRVLAGNSKLMQDAGIAFEQDELAGTVVHVAIDGRYAGHILIADEVKPDSAAAIQDLKQIRVKQTAMLTGDTAKMGAKVAEELGIDHVYTDLLPADKVEKLEELLAGTPPGGKLAYVGDGINDAPVLARADVGIAMGGLGSDAAIEAADVVIMTDEPSKLATAIRIARKTLRIAYQNAYSAIGIKVLVLVLSAIGFASMWAAVFADVGVTVLAVLNSFRALRVNTL